MIQIAISVICYDNEAEVLTYAEKLSRQKSQEKIVLIVTCNKCNDPAELQTKLRKIKRDSFVYVPGDNIGYLPGCLYGLKNYNGPYEWAVVSNTDIDFVSDDFFEKFLAHDYGSGTACIGPDVMLALTGKHQNPFARVRPGNLRMGIRRAAYSNYPCFILYNWFARIKNRIKKNHAPVSSGPVYGVHGSFMLIRKQCVDDFLQDKTPIFMYGEELYIAERLRKIGMQTYYDANLKIVHNENQSTGKIANKRKQVWFDQSMTYLVEQYWQA